MRAADAGRSPLSPRLRVMNLAKKDIRGFIGLSLIVLVQYSCSPRPHTFSISDSPDGIYRCVVMEQSPTWPKGSPFIYTFTIQDRTSGTDLPGQKLVSNLDSAEYNRLKFVWAIDQLTVLDSFETGDNRIAVAIFSNNRQEWTRL